MSEVNSMSEVNNNNDFSRQLELYNPEERHDNIHIVGVGATGSWVALMLSKLGVSNISLIDMDSVELHNIPNQIYGNSSIDMFKTNACSKIIKELGAQNSHIACCNEEINEGSAVLVSPVYCNATFCLVDSMQARKDILNGVLKAMENIENPNNKPFYWIETRMGLTGYRVYIIDLFNQYEVEEYKKTLYNDDEAETSACGASKSIVSTAMQCASHAVGLWLAKLNEAEYVPNELIFDTHSSVLIHKQFKPKEG